MKAIALIPHYNHSATLEALIQSLRAQGLPCLIVDDGSSPEHKQTACQIAHRYHCQFLERSENGGKGAALKTGFYWAEENGYSHALQIDADGQHRPEDAVAFLAAGEKNPTACICGKPQYDEQAPKSRLYGRKITNFWLWVNTGEKLPDGMCGYRLYPLRETVATLKAHQTGNRMDFDIEIMVLLFRRHVPFIWLPVAVRYPEDGISHFQLWRDNFRISSMHARLFFSGIWWRLTGK